MSPKECEHPLDRQLDVTTAAGDGPRMSGHQRWLPDNPAWPMPVASQLTLLPPGHGLVAVGSTVPPAKDGVFPSRAKTLAESLYEQERSMSRGHGELLVPDVRFSVPLVHTGRIDRGSTQGS